METMTRLTSVSGSFRAHVLAARLTAEGLDVELRGALHNPYALTMGDLALVDVFVPAEQVQDASYVMLASDIDAVLEYDHPARRRAPLLFRATAAALLVSALASVARLLI